MKIVPLNPNPSKEDALEVARSLVKAIENNEIVAFAAVGIEEDDCTRMWSSATRPVTRLRMMGAMYHLLACYQAEEF